ncbi:MAG TPA: SCP2 sterol-binding domain-containing protein [Roseiflexaceae bacterium]|nr:SCP2 sterol-binding domain-containing protein [Roseiflexaceae bacterium]
MTAFSSPSEYYTEVVPQQVMDALQGAPESKGQPDLIAIYEITGAETDIFALRFAGDQVEVLPEVPADADVRITLNDDDWRTSTAQGMLDPLTDYVQRRKVAVVKSLKGLVRVELTGSNGRIWQSATMFGGQAEPAVMLRMNADDYAAMMRGDLNGQMAFLTGKLQFEGSLPLLMQVGALSA